jgi:hypothetical protein
MEISETSLIARYRARCLLSTALQYFWHPKFVYEVVRKLRRKVRQKRNWISKLCVSAGALLRGPRRLLAPGSLIFITSRPPTALTGAWPPSIYLYFTAHGALVTVRLVFNTSWLGPLRLPQLCRRLFIICFMVHGSCRRLAVYLYF